MLDDVDSLPLPDPDRLDEDHLAAGCVQHPQRLRCRPRQPAKVPREAVDRMDILPFSTCSRMRTFFDLRGGRLW